MASSKKKKSAFLLLKFQQETAASSSSHVTYFMVPTLRRSWETKMKENWCTAWMGASEQESNGEHKLSISIESEGYIVRLTFGTWTWAPFCDAWREDNASRGLSWVVAQSDHGFWYNLLGDEVWEWTLMKRLWLWKIRNDDDGLL